MKVSKEHQEWIKQYAKAHNISEDQALNKLIGEVREAQEAERTKYQQEIIERLPSLNLEQIREVRQLVEKFAPSVMEFLSKVLSK